MRHYTLVLTLHFSFTVMWHICNMNLGQLSNLFNVENLKSKWEISSSLKGRKKKGFWRRWSRNIPIVVSLDHGDGGYAWRSNVLGKNLMIFNKKAVGTTDSIHNLDWTCSNIMQICDTITAVMRDHGKMKCSWWRFLMIEGNEPIHWPVLNFVVF